MARLEVLLPDELADRFRNEVARRLGMKKGNLSVAAEEAVELWLAKGKR